MIIDPPSQRGSHVYRLMTSLLVPRPIAWIGTRDAQGRDNLAPFSYFMGVASRPALVAVSIARRNREGELKDTAANLLETGVCSVSIVSEDALSSMHGTASRLEPGQSEFDHVGLEPVDCELVAAPRPACARVAMEARLHSAHDLGSTHLCVLEILRLHIDDALLTEDGLVDELALRPVARLGPSGYAALGALLEP